jgi:uncharacterized membrane protein
MDIQPVKPKPRLWEIDALRGLAVVAMMFFHFMWDLWFYKLTYEDVVGGGWQMFARGIGTTFIFVLGISATLDYARATAKSTNPIKRALQRGLLVFACGLLVSIGTYFFIGDAWVRFGILHHAGAAIIFAALFMRLPTLPIGLIGLGLIALGTYITALPSPTSPPWLIPFGLVPRGTEMVDYYPLLPWFGVALLGVATGKSAYANGVRQFSLPDLGETFPMPLLRWLGRHSLAVYLAHQFIFLALLIALLQLGVLTPLF